MPRLPALLCLLLAAAPLLAVAAPTSAYADAAGDEASIGKDNAAIDKASAALARDRMMRDQKSAGGDWFGQAVDSAGIGYDQFMIGEKKAERSIDEELLNQDSK